MKRLTDDRWVDTHATKGGTRISLGKQAPLPAHGQGHRAQSDTQAIHPSIHGEDAFSDASGDLFGAPAPGKGKRLPADWVLPKSWGEWAMSQGLDRQQVIREAATFRDYWIAQTGQKAVKKDWASTWRNWIRRKTEDRRAAAPPSSDLVNQILGRA